MKFSFGSNGPSGLAAFVSLALLSIPSIVSAVALPQNRVDVKQSREDSEYYGTQITQGEYEDYLRRYWNPATTRYMLYTGNSAQQADDFGKAPGNGAYKYYEDFFNAGREPKYYEQAFPPQGEKWRMDDAEAASRAIANVAQGDVKVFGGAKWADFPDSFLATDEMPRVRDGMANGRITSVTHMKKEGTEWRVMGTDNGNGGITYQNGYTAATTIAGCGRKRAVVPKIGTVPKTGPKEGESGGTGSVTSGTGTKDGSGTSGDDTVRIGAGSGTAPKSGGTNGEPVRIGAGTDAASTRVNPKNPNDRDAVAC
jgi:hypothetical protein